MNVSRFVTLVAFICMPITVCSSELHGTEMCQHEFNSKHKFSFCPNVEKVKLSIEFDSIYYKKYNAIPDSVKNIYLQRLSYINRKIGQNLKIVDQTYGKKIFPDPHGALYHIQVLPPDFDKSKLYFVVFKSLSKEFDVYSVELAFSSDKNFEESLKDKFSIHAKAVFKDIFMEY